MPTIFEIVEDFLATAADGTAYWANTLATTRTTLTIADREADHPGPRTINATELIDWARSDRPAALAATAGDPYQKQCIAAVAAALNDPARSDDDDFDYDAGTADMIIQDIVHGSITYS